MTMGASITLAFTQFCTDGREGESKTWVLQLGREYPERDANASPIMLGLSEEKREIVQKRVEDFVRALERDLSPKESA